MKSLPEVERDVPGAFVRSERVGTPRSTFSYQLPMSSAVPSIPSGPSDQTS